MRFTSLSISCLAWSFASLTTTRAFSLNTAAARLGSVATSSRHSSLNVASTPTIAVADMERGVGGRIEAAFEAAKEKGEAAFVSFITAGYPAAQGMLKDC